MIIAAFEDDEYGYICTYEKGQILATFWVTKDKDTKKVMYGSVETMLERAAESPRLESTPFHRAQSMMLDALVRWAAQNK